MKMFIRVGAVVSFLCCFLSGVCLVIPALSSRAKDGFVVAALGLFLIGMAFFFGLMIWLAGEKRCSKQE